MMKRKIFTIFLAGMFLLTGFAVASAEVISSGGKNQDEGSIGVYVFAFEVVETADPPGLEGIEVELVNQDGTYSDSGITNKEGFVIFLEVPLDDIYTVTVKGNDEYQGGSRKVELTKENPNVKLEFRLEPKARSYIKQNLDMIWALLSYFKHMISNCFYLGTNLVF